MKLHFISHTYTTHIIQNSSFLISFLHVRQKKKKRERIKMEKVFLLYIYKKNSKGLKRKNNEYSKFVGRLHMIRMSSAAGYQCAIVIHTLMTILFHPCPEKWITTWESSTHTFQHIFEIKQKVAYTWLNTMIHH